MTLLNLRICIIFRRMDGGWNLGYPYLLHTPVMPINFSKRQHFSRLYSTFKENNGVVYLGTFSPSSVLIEWPPNSCTHLTIISKCLGFNSISIASGYFCFAGWPLYLEFWKYIELHVNLHVVHMEKYIENKVFQKIIKGTWKGNF